MLLNFQLVQAESLFLMAKTSAEVLKHLDGISENSIIFIDIDDTVITPVSKTFRKAPYNKLMDEIKKNKHQYKNYEEILSNWRLQRKAMLLDSNWPDVLSRLKQSYRVYGLTQMDNGEFGNIKSMEEWRHAELKSLGIEFADDGIVPQEPINNASFYKGLFFTGANSKSQTISHYAQYLKANTFVMIDDREGHLENIKQFCEENSIQFIGIKFAGLENSQDEPNPEIAALQKKYLIEYAKWLEDDEAAELIKQN
jgi:predicted phosphatase